MIPGLIYDTAASKQKDFMRAGRFAYNDAAWHMDGANRWAKDGHERVVIVSYQEAVRSQRRSAVLYADARAILFCLIDNPRAPE